MIQIENLTKEYDLPTGKAGQIVAADRLNLTIPAGEIFGLVGPNGAGKTTTLKMICGLLVPTAGRVAVNNVDVEQRPEDAQKHIGYLSDFFSCYDDLKVWEYFDFFANAYKMDAGRIPGRINEVIRLMNLESKRDAFIAGLSRGMKQRLGIGRAILHDPPVLILDEPASGLDPKARLELKLLIKELNKAGKTVFITSHVLSDLEEICTSIGILEKGKLLRVGALEQILRGEAAPGATVATAVAAAGARRYRVRLAAPGFALVEWLRARAGVTEITLDSGGPVATAQPIPAGPSAGAASETAAQFNLAGADAELAGLVRDLVTAGAPVCGVEEIVKSLEQLYFQLSTGEVM
jgi:ABC-2 type transport system ATP-binding protein